MQHLHLAAVGDFGQEGIDNRGHAGGQPFDLARGKDPLHQAAQPRVGRRVAQQHPLFGHLVNEASVLIASDCDPVRAYAPDLTTETWLFECSHHIAIAGEIPTACRTGFTGRAPMDRVVYAERSVKRIGVGEDGRGQWVKAESHEQPFAASAGGAAERSGHLLRADHGGDSAQCIRLLGPEPLDLEPETG